MKDLIFYNLFKANLLFYSWNQLKSPKFLGYFLPSGKNFSPFSSFWFKKTAYLIREGRFVYKMRSKKKFFKYKNKRALFNTLSQFVIELSFINLLQKTNKSCSIFDLTTCVRYLKTNYINFLLFYLLSLLEVTACSLDFSGINFKQFYFVILLVN